MKKHIFIILLAALLLLAACQPTPDEPPVLQKDQDLMIQKGEATLPPEETYTPPEAPERFVYDFTDGTWTVHADAPIIVPDVPMPMVWVRSQGISQETLYRLFHLLGNGETFYLPDMDHISTKSEIAESIQSMMDQLEDGSYKDTDLSEEEWKAAIAELEKKYKTAPEENPHEQQESDGTYMLLDSKRFDTERLYLSASSRYRSIGATAYFKADGEGSCFHYYRHLDVENRKSSYSMANARKVDASSELPEGLSYADAAAMLNEVFETIGEPFEIVNVFLIDDAAQGHIDGDTFSAKHYALRFVCRRLIHGAPMVCNDTGAGNFDQIFSIPWTQERFSAVIDSVGFVSIEWEEPLTILDTVSESTNLLPFSEIREIAEKMFPIIYQHQAGYEHIAKLDTQITSVRLELIRVREQNNTKQLKGLLIPAWSFYGSCCETNTEGETSYINYGMGSGCDYYGGDQILLCINAIDGTVIDPLLGY